MSKHPDPIAVADFWFALETKSYWWKKDPDFDRQVSARLGTAHARAAAGALDGWRESADGSLALVILLDQVPRNIYRDSALAFAFDAQARSVAANALSQGHDAELPHERRFLLFMPFEHSESAADQTRSLALFEAYGDEKLLGYAQRHSKIVQRFGRFPHRNAVLGRASTAEETAFLDGPGSSF